MKKRAFLLPLAASVAVLIGGTTASDAIAKAPTATETVQASAAIAPSADAFVIERSEQEALRTSYHSSHRSHSSHSSHRSHSSHYSSRY